MPKAAWAAEHHPSAVLQELIGLGLADHAIRDCLVDGRFVRGAHRGLELRVVDQGIPGLYQSACCWVIVPFWTAWDRLASKAFW